MEAWIRSRLVNPRLVMLSISGYGQTGPYAPRAAYDRIALAFSGLLHVTGDPDRPPLRPGTAVADYQSALFGAFAVMVALYHRDVKNGTGQHIDVSLFESVFRFTDVMVTAYDKLGVARMRVSNRHFAAAPGDHFATSDGRYLVLTVSTDGLFRRLCKAMGRPDLVTDPRFATHAERWKNILAINDVVGDWVESKPVADVSAALEGNGLAYSLVYSARETVSDPQYAARATIATADNPRIGPLKMPAPQPKFSATPAPAPRATPTLGEQTDLVLGGLLGLSKEAISGLKARGCGLMSSDRPSRTVGPARVDTEPLRYPWEMPPGPTDVTELAPGLLWLRLKLPFRLNHVNIYLLADGDGWTMVDAGFGNEDTVAAWTGLFEGPLASVRITRLIENHAHPDHIGLAGWMVKRFGCTLCISQAEYLQGAYRQNLDDPDRLMRSAYSFAGTIRSARPMSSRTQSGDNNAKPDAGVGESFGFLANPGGAFIQG